MKEIIALYINRFGMDETLTQIADGMEIAMSESKTYIGKQACYEVSLAVLQVRNTIRKLES